jgi:nucleoside-triphosphatase
MSSKPAKILLTGLPGCGKTTAVMKIISTLDTGKVAGFYTQEIREENTRKGFSWTRLDGVSGILSHVNTKSPCKVGRYGVDISEFERSVVPILDVDYVSTELFIIDEIGKMECFSKKFITAVRRLFASDRLVLATVAKKGKGFISEVKNYPGTKLFNLTAQNRDKIIDEISQILTELEIDNERVNKTS